MAGLTVTKPGMAQSPIGNGGLGARDFHSGRENIELRLGPSGALTGKVAVEQTGQPVAGVSVWLLPSTEAGTTHGPAVTDGGGVFRFADLQPAAYNVWSVIPGHPVPDWTVVPEFGLATITAGKTTADFPVHVTAGVLVEVTVVSTNDLAPLPNVTVSSGRLSVVTDARGVAGFRLIPGKAWLGASKPRLAIFSNDSPKLNLAI